MISRGTRLAKLIESNLWHHGPNFLVNSTCEPKETFDLTISNEDTEVKIIEPLLTCNTNDNVECPVELLMSSVSSWYKLKKRIASFIMLKDALKL